MRLRGGLFAAALLAIVATGPAAHADTYPHTQDGSNDGVTGVVTISVDGGVVIGACSFRALPWPDPDTTPVVVEGSAHATARGITNAVATGVRCVLKRADTDAVVLDGSAAMVGAHAAVGPLVAYPDPGEFTICIAVSALWSDSTHMTHGAPVCEPPAA